jgi:hypothetical protein
MNHIESYFPLRRVTAAEAHTSQTQSRFGDGNTCADMNTGRKIKRFYTRIATWIDGITSSMYSSIIDSFIIESHCLYHDHEHLLNTLITILLNTLHVSFLFFKNDWTIVFSLLLTVYSIWNSYALFTRNKHYHIIRRNGNIKNDNNNPSLVTFERLGKRIPDIVIDNQRYKVWKVCVWDYTSIQRVIFW